MRSFLLIVAMILGGCGTEEVPQVALRSEYGDIYQEDLLQADATTIDALREYLLNKKVGKGFADTPFKQENDGRGDIDDLLWGLELVKHLYGINPIFALALSIHESGWGTNSQGRYKHNLWGWNSGYCTSANRCGDSFDKATGFGSYGNGFNTVFRKIRDNYLTERDPVAGTGRYYHKCRDRKRVRCVGNDVKEDRACGASLAGMNCSYAENDNWAKLMRGHMNDINAYIDNYVEVEPTTGCAVVEE